MNDPQRYDLLDAVPLGVFVIDAGYTVLFWNTTLEEWTARPRHAMIGRHIGEAYPQLMEARYTSRLAGIFQGGPPTIFSSQLHRYIIPVPYERGKYRIQHTTVTAVDGDGTAPHPYHAMFSIQDVTDLTERINDYREMRDEALTEVHTRRAMESKLMSSEARYRALSELITDFAFSLTRRDDGSYEREWVTEAFTYVTGYDHETFQTLTDWTRMIHPDDLADVERMYRTLQAAWADDQLEHRILTREGKVRYVETHLRPVVDYDTRRVTKIYGAVQDITRRKLAERRLRESEERFRQIAENIEVVVYIGDRANTEIIYVNPAYERVTGQTRRRIYGDPLAFRALIHQDDRADVEATYQAAHANNERIDITFRIRRPKSHQVRWVRERTFPITDDNGTSTRYIGLLEDVTAQKEASEREFAFALEREQVQLLSSFISDATHEFRTPLSVINSSTYLLSKLQDEEKRERYTTLIQEQVSAISELVDVLVLMVGLDNQPQGQPEQVDINSVFKMILDQFVVRLRESRHITTTRYYGAPLYVHGHPSHLWQALVAIVDNAIRYTPETGRITLRSAKLDDHAILEVEDTGPGIAAAELPKIFDRFYRVDKAHSTRGFGLGLPIAKKIIERHGGQIEVHSRVGEGSLFRVRLPLGEANKPATSTSEVENHFRSAE